MKHFKYYVLKGFFSFFLTLSHLHGSDIKEEISHTTVKVTSHEHDKDRGTLGTGFFYIDYPDYNLYPGSKVDGMYDDVEIYNGLSSETRDRLYQIEEDSVKIIQGIRCFKKSYFNKIFEKHFQEKDFSVVHPSNEGDNASLYVITNRHVLLGKDKKSPRKTPGLKFSFNFQRNGDKSQIFKEDCYIVCNDQNTFYHPELNVDIAAINISSLIREKELRDNITLVYKAFSSKDIPKEDFFPTDSLNMIGYPKGLRDEVNNLPIVRGGSFSTRYQNDWNGNAEFLADIPSFPGSSGSPVIKVFPAEESSLGLDNVISMIPERAALLGILKGGPYFTLSKSPKISMPMGLGRVIKAEKIKDFIESIRNGRTKPFDVVNFEQNIEDENLDYGLDDLE